MDDAAFRILVDEVRRRTDIVTLVFRDIPLKSCGSVWKGRSPFNTDQNPSLVIWPVSQRWRDYSGGGEAGGDCLAWVQYFEKTDFMGALRILAGRVGLDVPDGQPSSEATAAVEEERRIRSLLTTAATYYHERLTDDIREGWYRKRYGFADATIERFVLGWADGTLWDYFCNELRISRADALATGLFVPFPEGRVVDFFQGRLIFPYLVPGGVAYLIGRQTEKTPDQPWERDAKYRKLPIRSDSHPYISARIANDVLFNAQSARSADLILLTEGIADCISAQQAGVAAISPGTTIFRRQDLPRLLEITRKARRVVVCNDAEDGGSGDLGAIDTARFFLKNGRPIRIGQIPRLANCPKRDVNDLVREEGPGALQKVIASARLLPELLIERIPADTPKKDLSEPIRSVLPLLEKLEPLERSSCRELILKRFRLRPGELGALEKALRIDQAGQRREEDGSRPPLKGEVLEGSSHYYVIDRTGHPRALSSFVLVPRRRVLLEDGEVFEVDARSAAGTLHERIFIPRDGWNSRAAFLGLLAHGDLQWTGDDDNVQAVLNLVSQKAIPSLCGTRVLGLTESDGGPLWVAPDAVLSASGTAACEGYVFVPAGATLPPRVRFQKCLTHDEACGLARQVLPAILGVNVPGVVLPILGWFVAAPLKSRIMRLLGHFPLLCIWGSQGSGKSSLVTEVFWLLVGVASTEPYSATETEFALLKLLSCTNGVPVFIDEYRPNDMAIHRVQQLHRFMRRLYTGDVEERGQRNQTLVTYRLAAPLCIAGETRPTEAALLERMVTASPRKRGLEDPSHVEAFATVRANSPLPLAPFLIEFLLGRDVSGDVENAKRWILTELGERNVPQRVVDNLAVMVAGLTWFWDFANEMSVELSERDFRPAVDAVVDDVLEGRAAVRSGLDLFLEMLSAIAVAKKLESGVQYYVTRERKLALHIPSCFEAYREHTQRTGYRGELLDRTALNRLLRENMEAGGYVEDAGRLTSFGSQYHKCRAAIIDLERASQDLQLDGFSDPDGGPQ
jgi:DNA primase